MGHPYIIGSGFSSLGLLLYRLFIRNGAHEDLFMKDDYSRKKH
jgi:hypothetical protein